MVPAHPSRPKGLYRASGPGRDKGMRALRCGVSVNVVWDGSQKPEGISCSWWLWDWIWRLRSNSDVAVELKEEKTVLDESGRISCSQKVKSLFFCQDRERHVTSYDAESADKQRRHRSPKMMTREMT